MAQWFRNLKVGGKLALGFSVMILFIGLIGFIGYQSISTVQRSLDEIFEVRWPSINYILEADRDLFQLLVAERSMMFTDTRIETFQELQDFYEENRQQAEERWEKYKALIQTDEEQALVPEFEAARAEWEATAKLVLNGMRATTSDSRTNIRDLALGETAEKFEAMRDVLDKLTELNQNIAETAHHTARVVYKRTIFIFLALTGLGLASGIGFAIVIGFGVTSPLKTAVFISHRLAEGDLTQKITIDRHDETGQLLTAMQDMMTMLRRVVKDVRVAADFVASGSQQMSSSATQMSEGSNEQAAAAEELSSSMEEMAANISQNNDNALMTEKIAVKAAKDARKSGKTVKKTVKAMETIAEEIAVIKEIANQTRMLSLNATIEAGKAQDFGKGFAVVASEVRALAGRTQKVAKIINDLADSGVSVVQKTGQSLKALVPDIQKTAELVQEISAASQEQASGARQVNQAVQQLDNVVQEHSAMSEQLAATSEELAAQARQLQLTISFFQIQTTDEQGEEKPAKRGEVLMSSEKKAQEGISKTPDREHGEGVPLDMIPLAPEKDDRDDEFERF